MGQSWSLIVFSYNEKGNIERFLPNVALFCATYFKDILYEVLVIDDGSNDGSELFIKKFANQHQHFKVFRHSKNKGIGNALKKGYEMAQYSNICAVPGDNQFDIEELKNYLSFDEQNYISFYRPVKDGYNWFRNILSYFNKLANKYFLRLDLKDVNWIKVYKRSQLDRINIQLQSSLIESEICTKLNHLNIRPIEVPSKYLTREHGKSKGGSYKTVTKAVFEIILLLIESIKFKKQL